MVKKKAEVREEELRENLKTKEVYYFVDSEKKINQKCREVFKDKKEIIHYPFGYEGGQRYQNIKRFVFVGFESNADLPVGIIKSANYGYGFTKVLKAFGEVLDQSMYEEVRVLKTGTTGVTGKTLTLTKKSLETLHPIFQNCLDRHKDEKLNLAKTQLATLYPNNFKAPVQKYIKDSTFSVLSTWSQAVDDFSPRDKEAIRTLFDSLLLTDEFLTPETLLKTKSTLDKQYIDEVTKRYEGLLTQKNETNTLEKKWQKFFKENSWIFSYIFSFPIMLMTDEAYVGGKTLSNKNGKVTDFLVKNNLTDNVAFLEIKTHRSKILGPKKAYRGNDVFSIDAGLTGAINQVLDQRDNFQKEFYTHKGKSELPFETFNSKCVILIGMVEDLNKKQKQSFELFRSNSKDVEIITFDELLGRILGLQKLIVANS